MTESSSRGSLSGGYDPMPSASGAPILLKANRWSAWCSVSYSSGICRGSALGSSSLGAGALRIPRTRPSRRAAPNDKSRTRAESI